MSISRLKVLFLFLSVTQFAHAQSSKYFKKIIGLPSPNIEHGRSVKQLPSGEYIIAGIKADNNTLKVDSYIAKTDAFGNLISEVFQPDSLAYVYYEDLKLTNGECILAGAYRQLIPSDQENYLVKTNNNGDTLWSRKTLNPSNNSAAYCVQNTLSGGFIICGYKEDTSTWNQGNVVSFDSSGNVLWDSIYQGPFINSINWIEQMQDSGFIFTGYTNYVIGFGDALLKKINKNGYTQWTQIYHYTGDYSTLGNCVKKTLDDGFIIAGESGTGFGIANQPLLIKTDSLGIVQWMKKIYDVNGSLMHGNTNRIFVMPDSTFVGCGVMLPNANANYVRMTLFKVNSNGDLIWIRKFTQDSNYDAYAWDMDTTSDGGFVITGRMESAANADIYLVKTNCLGFTGPPVANYIVNSNGITVTFINLSQRADTCIFTFGDGDSAIAQLTDTLPITHTYSTNGSYVVTLIVYACGESDTFQINITTGMENASLYDNTFKVQPNPARDFITVDYFIPFTSRKAKIIMTNIIGQVLKTFSVSNGKQSSELNISDAFSGVYFLNLNIDGKIVCSRKLFIIK
jgi:PKD repeat protein